MPLSTRFLAVSSGIAVVRICISLFFIQCFLELNDSFDYLPLVRELQKVDYTLFADWGKDPTVSFTSKPEEMFVMKLYTSIPGGKIQKSVLLPSLGK